LNLPPKETASLKQEFYGPHFSLFVRNLTGIPTLQSNMESATSDNQKEAALKFVKDIVAKGITKSFFGYTFFQELLAEYITTIDPSDIRELASSVADHSIHLLSTRAGTRVVASIASYGTPKDRKRICKSMKGYTSSSLLHRDAYLALIRLIQVTDDTVSIQKSVLNEIIAKPKDDEDGSEKPLLLDLAMSDTASKMFLFLLTGDAESKMKYFDPYERSILEPIPEIKGVCTYKKDPETHRQELLKHIRQDLIDLCINHVEELLLSLPGFRVLKEVYIHSSSEELVNAIMQVCESTLEGDKDTEAFSLFEHPTGHRAIKNLIMCDAEKNTTRFSEAFLERLGGKLVDVAGSNRGAFVVAALFKVKSIQPKVLKILRSQKKEVMNLSKQSKSSAGSKSNAGYDALLKEIS
jgi:pumilio family protein 6